MRLGINGRFYRAAVTGVQRFAREVTARLAGMADVTLLLPRGVDSPLDPAVRCRHGRLRGHAWEQLELPWMARAAGCDVTLHLSGTAPFHGGPHVLVIHDVLPLTHPEWFSRGFARWYGTVLPRAARNAAAIITVSAESRREIVRVLGTPRRLSLVPQGMGPFDLPAAAAEIQNVRTRMRLPEQWLLAVGRKDPRKNHAFLSGVLAELRARGQPITLVVVGDAPARVHGHQPDLDGPDVRLPGHVTDDELRALYTGALALCFPSLAEGFGRPPVEATACGTPSLVADLAAVPEPARQAGLALPLDVAAWADAIGALRRDAALRQEIVARGRATLAGMNWEACAQRVLEACTGTVRPGRAGRRAAGSRRRDRPNAISPDSMPASPAAARAPTLEPSAREPVVTVDPPAAAGD